MPEGAAAGWCLGQEDPVLTPGRSSATVDIPQKIVPSCGISVTTLQDAERHYTRVTRLVSSINDLTSVPSLFNHAAALVNVLVNAFVLLTHVLESTSAVEPLPLIAGCIEPEYVCVPPHHLLSGW